MTNLAGKKEEITDILTPEGIKSGEFKKGQMLKFTQTNIKITKIDKKNGRAWGVHVEPMKYHTAITHYGHIIDATDDAMKEYGAPFCEDCEIPVDEEATKEGKKKATERSERTLSDGTVIE